jgi:hypothetical protein
MPSSFLSAHHRLPQSSRLSYRNHAPSTSSKQTHPNKLLTLDPFRRSTTQRDSTGLRSFPPSSSSSRCSSAALCASAYSPPPLKKVKRVPQACGCEVRPSSSRLASSPLYSRWPTGFNKPTLARAGPLGLSGYASSPSLHMSFSRCRTYFLSSEKKALRRTRRLVSALNFPPLSNKPTVTACTCAIGYGDVMHVHKACVLNRCPERKSWCRQFSFYFLSLTHTPLPPCRVSQELGEDWGQLYGSKAEYASAIIINR